MTDCRMACLGAETIATREGPEHFEECRACGTAVRWDLVDHSFFGFRANCERPTNAKSPAPAEAEADDMGGEGRDRQ